MGKEHVLNVIFLFKKYLSERGIDIYKIILFGSYSTGNAREDSDIDIVVISDSFKNMEYWERIDILSDAICEVLMPIEAVALTVDEWNKKDLMITHYAKNGIEV